MRRRNRGVVMVSVLFYVLLLVSAIATFVRRASVDGLIARGRDRSAQAEALARGAIPLALGLVLEDRLQESQAEPDPRVERRSDVWALVGRAPLELEGGGELRLRIDDAGSRVNLNALFEAGEPRDAATEIFLERFFAKLVLEIQARRDKATREPQVERPSGSRDRAAYDPRQLAQNLIDWVDADQVRVIGGPEDAYYQDQVPPYRAANRPLLSVDELAMVEGFDTAFVEALRPYVAVYPLVGGGGINPNTAPSYVLAALFFGPPGDQRLATASTVRNILDIRAGGGILCADAVQQPDCTPIQEVLPGEVYPPATFQSEVFHVTAEARVADVQRTVEAVIDRTDPSLPRLLYWRLR